jgi:putative aldouronate transport system substrate-binding protein
MKAQEPYYEEKDGKWYFTDVQPEYKEMLDFMKKCYNEGLFDPEFLTNTQAQWSAKMSQPEKAFVSTDWIGRLEQFEEQTKGTYPEFDLRFAPPMGPDQTYPEASQVCWPRYVSASSKNIETAFKLLDFCLSDAGAELISMGAEGETYNLNDQGKAVYVGFEDRIPQITDLEEKYGMYIEGMYLRYDRRSAHFQFSEREQEGQDYAKDPKHISPADPILVFTPEEKARKNECLATLLKSGREFATKYILNKNAGEKEWNEWLKTAERQGYKEVEAIYNAAQERFNKM